MRQRLVEKINEFGGSVPGCNDPGVLLGDVNLDGVVNLLDVRPFIEILTNNQFQVEADINQDGNVDLLDVQPFADLITG